MNFLKNIFNKINSSNYYLPLILTLTVLFGLVVYKPTNFLNYLKSSTSSSTPSIRSKDARLSMEKMKKYYKERREIENAPLIFEPVDLSSISEKYNVSSDFFLRDSFYPVSCLVNSIEKNYKNFENLEERVDDQIVIDHIKQIENHGFTNLGYNNICKLNDNYFFSFYSYGKDTTLSSGQAPPSHFAYTNSAGGLTIIEKMEKEQIELPESSDDSVPTTTSGSAYYGCRQIYAANNSEVILGCGGGDGPVSTGSLFAMDLTTEVTEEKIFCHYSSVGKYNTLCYNEDSEIYFEQLNLVNE